MLEVDHLMDPSMQTFNCDVCYAELVDNHDSEEVVQSKNKMNRYFSQTAKVIDGLKKADQVVLPAYVSATLLVFAAPF
jgi:transcription initiation factor TFIIE subunit alpha